MESALKIMAMVMFLLMAAGCGSEGETSPTPVSTAPSEDESRNAPLPSPPPWVEASIPITRDNVNQVRLLGRLDMPEPRSTLFAYAFSPDGTRLAGLNNTRLLAWDLVTGELILNNARQGAAWLFYAPDKTRLYAVDESGRVMLYDADTGRQVEALRGHTAFAQTVAFYEDDGWLALGGEDGTVKVWDPYERVSLVTFDAQDGAVRGLTFSQDGEMLASADDNGGVRIWRWRERELIATLENNPMLISRMAFSPGGTRIAVGLSDHIAMWSIAEEVLAYVLRTGPGGASDVLAFSPDGEYLVNGGVIPDMNVWEAESGELLALLPDIGGERTSAAFSPDSSMLLAVVMDGPMTLWDMRSITDSTVVQGQLDLGDVRILVADWTPDGFLMIFIDAHGPVYVWGLPPMSQ